MLLLVLYYLDENDVPKQSTTQNCVQFERQKVKISNVASLGCHNVLLHPGDHILELVELESVEIINSECTDNSLQLLIQDSNTKIVQLNGKYLSGEYLVPPSSTTSSVIENLNLSGCRNLSASGIVGLLNNIGKTLKILNLSYTLVSFSIVGSLTSNFPLLEVLSLEHCHNLSEAGVKGFINKIGATLNLTRSGISFSNVGALTSDFPMMEVLKLTGCSKCTEAGIMEQNRRNPQDP